MLHLLLAILSLPILALALSAPPSAALIVRGTGTKTGEYSTISKAVAAAGDQRFVSLSYSLSLAFLSTHSRIIFLINLISGTGSDAKVIFVYSGESSRSLSSLVSFVRSSSRFAPADRDGSPPRSVQEPTLSKVSLWG